MGYQDDNGKKEYNNIGLWEKKTKAGGRCWVGQVTKENLVDAVELLKDGKKVDMMLIESKFSKDSAPTFNATFKENTYVPKPKNGSGGFSF